MRSVFDCVMCTVISPTLVDVMNRELQADLALTCELLFAPHVTALLSGLRFLIIIVVVHIKP